MSSPLDSPYDLVELAYDKHAENCGECFLLSGEFCVAGEALQEALEVLEKVERLGVGAVRAGEYYTAKVTGFVQESASEYVLYDLYYKDNKASFGRMLKREFEQRYPRALD